jgi:hypothetical protein
MLPRAPASTVHLAHRVALPLPRVCTPRACAGIVNTSEMITHVYPLSRVQEAFELRNDKSPGNPAIHVLVNCQAKDDSVVLMNSMAAPVEGAASGL